MHEFDPENPLRIARPDGKELDLRAGIRAQQPQSKEAEEKRHEIKGNTKKYDQLKEENTMKRPL